MAIFLFICCADCPFFISINQDRSYRSSVNTESRISSLYRQFECLVESQNIQKLFEEITPLHYATKLLSADSSDCYCVLGRAETCMPREVY